MNPLSRLVQRAKDRLPDLRHDSEFWRRGIRWGAVKGPDRFIRHSPPFFGAVFAAILPDKRRRIAENFRWVGRRGTTAEVLSVFSTYALSLTEAFAVGSGRNAQLKARVVGDRHFQEARSAGRGVVIATAHTSGWYAAGPILGSVYPDEVLIVMQEERDANAQRIQQEARDRLGLKVVHVGTDPLAAMPLLAHLRKGGVVALQMDRVPKGQRSIEVVLGGRTFAVPEGPLMLAGLAQAPILVVLGRRTGFLEYEVEVGEAIHVPRRASRDELLTAATALTRQIEGFVGRNPSDWFHFAESGEGS